MSVVILRAISRPESNGKPSWNEERRWFPEQLLKLLLLHMSEGGMLLAPAVWMVKKKKIKIKRKHNKQFLLSRSKPKPTPKRSQSLCAPRRSGRVPTGGHPWFAVTFELPGVAVWAPQRRTVWRGSHGRSSPRPCVTHPREAFKPHLHFGLWEPEQQEMLQEMNYKKNSLQTAAVAYRKNGLIGTPRQASE